MAQLNRGRVVVTPEIRDQVQALCNMPSSHARMSDKDINFIDSLAKYIESATMISSKQYRWLQNMIEHYEP